jgi:hypothetical protein
VFQYPEVLSSFVACGLIRKAQEPLARPNNSLSKRVSTTAEPLQTAKNLAAAGLKAGSALAVSSLPVTVAPGTSTVRKCGANLEKHFLHQRTLTHHSLEWNGVQPCAFELQLLLSLPGGASSNSRTLRFSPFLLKGFSRKAAPTSTMPL